MKVNWTLCYYPMLTFTGMILYPSLITPLMNVGTNVWQHVIAKRSNTTITLVI